MNRTIVELRQISIMHMIVKILSMNRTIVELRPALVPFQALFSVSYESNHSGIETGRHRSQPRRTFLGMNRTIVELRRRAVEYFYFFLFLYESNHSGIETGTQTDFVPVLAEYESNHSGIETPLASKQS